MTSEERNIVWAEGFCFHDLVRATTLYLYPFSGKLIDRIKELRLHLKYEDDDADVHTFITSLLFILFILHYMYTMFYYLKSYIQ